MAYSQQYFFNNLSKYDRLDKDLVPSNVSNYINKIFEDIDIITNIKAINEYLEINPVLLKQILEYNQILKLSYCTYAQKKYRSSTRIKWSSKYSDDNNILTFKDQISMYQFMVRYGGNNNNTSDTYRSHMQYLSNIVLSKLQKANIAIQYMSTNKEYCSKYLTDNEFSKNIDFLFWIKKNIFKLGPSR